MMAAAPPMTIISTGSSSRSSTWRRKARSSSRPYRFTWSPGFAEHRLEAVEAHVHRETPRARERRRVPFGEHGLERALGLLEERSEGEGRAGSRRLRGRLDPGILGELARQLEEEPER